MKPNLKEKLKYKKITLGTWITIGHPSIVEVLATASFDWMCVDMEHTSISLETAQLMISTIQANQINALVRVPQNEPNIIKQVLDLGADGVIIPMVNSKLEAEKAVSSVYYPPKGKRGVGLYRAQNYGVGFDEYKKKLLNEGLVVIAQIEHIDAVNNINEILSVDGVDGCMIGPYDLSSSIGYPGDYNREDVKSALDVVIKACKVSNKSLGFHVIPSRESDLISKVDEGYSFISFSVDFFFLGDRAREEMIKIRSALKVRNT